jgi:hypothetical protein
MLRTCWGGEAPSASPAGTFQAPRGNPLRPEITAEVPPRCSPLGDENGVQLPWAAPTCPSQTYNRHKDRRAGRLGASSISRPGRRAGWLWNLRPERTTRRPSSPCSLSVTSDKPTRINLRQLPLSRDRGLTSRPGLPPPNRLGSTSANYHSPGTAASQADPDYPGQTDSDQPPPRTTPPGPRPHKPTRAGSQSWSHSPTRPPWTDPPVGHDSDSPCLPPRGNPCRHPAAGATPQCPHKDGALPPGPEPASKPRPGPLAPGGPDSDSASFRHPDNPCRHPAAGATPQCPHKDGALPGGPVQ